MAYITEKYYKTAYGGNQADDSLKGRIVAATTLIDALTHNRIKAMGFDNLTPFQQKSVKKATCLIADHMANGGQMPGTDIQSYSLQDMRVNMRRRKQRPWEVAGCGMWAWFTLMQTGLMRGLMP